MQAVLTGTRTETASILRRTTVSDDAGGSIDSWPAVETGLSARVTPQGMQPWERTDRIGGRVVSTSVWNIALPAGTDVRPADRIQVGDVVYDVIAPRNRGSLELERVVQAVLLQ